MAAHKIGRPLSKNPRSEEIKIRATKEEKALLKELSVQTGMTQTEIVLDGIRLVAEKIK